MGKGLLYDEPVIIKTEIAMKILELGKLLKQNYEDYAVCVLLNTGIVIAGYKEMPNRNKYL